MTINRANFKFETISGALDLTERAEDEKHCAQILMAAADAPGGKVYFKSDGYADGLPRYSYTVADQDGAVRATGQFEICAEMSPDELEQIGTALFGRKWQTRLAEELDMNPRSVGNFMSGKQTVQSHTKANILDLIKRRHAEIKALHDFYN